MSQNNDSDVQEPFYAAIFIGKLIGSIVRSVQPFSTVGDSDLIHMMDYIKEELDLEFRRTLMRHMGDFYSQTKDVLKSELGKIDSVFFLFDSLVA